MPQLFVSPADGHFSTISAALAAANDGDQILVSPAAYHEQLNVTKCVVIKPSKVLPDQQVQIISQKTVCLRVEAASVMVEGIHFHQQNSPPAATKAVVPSESDDPSLRKSPVCVRCVSGHCTLIGCKLSSQSHAIMVTSNAQLTLRGCEFKGVKHHALVVLDQAILVLNQVQLWDVADCGIFARQQCRVQVHDVRMGRTGNLSLQADDLDDREDLWLSSGVRLFDKARLTMSRCVLSVLGWGIVLCDDSVARVDHVTFEWMGHCAISLIGKAEMVAETSGEVKESAACLCASGDSKVSLSNWMMSRIKRTAIYLFGKANVSVQSSRIECVDDRAIVLRDEAKLMFVMCTISNWQVSTAITLTDQAKLDCIGVNITSVKNGIITRNESEAKIKDTSIQCEEYGTIHLDSSRTNFEDIQISAGYDGILAGDRSTVIVPKRDKIICGKKAEQLLTLRLRDGTIKVVPNQGVELTTDDEDEDEDDNEATLQPRTPAWHSTLASTSVRAASVVKWKVKKAQPVNQASQQARVE